MSALNITKEVADMKRLTVDQLRIKYGDVFGETTNSRNKDWLIKRIAWRLQANIHGGLSARAITRARELANAADVRVIPPKEGISPNQLSKVVQLHASASDARLPATGLAIHRMYKGKDYEVVIKAGGFEFEGEHYRSLSAVAKRITGQHWNGFRFFGLDHQTTTGAKR